MTVKQVENGGKFLLITSLFMVILQGSLLVTVAINNEKDKEQERKIEYMWKDYMPTVFMDGMMRTYSLQTQSIVAEIGGDPVKVKVQNEKFDELRKELLNTLQQLRGGPTSITRSIKQSSGTDNGASQ